MVECQIWLGDDQVKTKSSPCTCEGLYSHFVLCNVSYARRACVQHWCSKKCDITCEICHEVSCS
ncbi:unnamed protein product, partial [Musa acuminata subsp. burmannicoides]